MLRAQCNGCRVMTPSVFRMVPCKYIAAGTLFYLPPGTKSPRKKKADWQPSPAGSLAPFHSALMSFFFFFFN